MQDPHVHHVVRLRPVGMAPLEEALIREHVAFLKRLDEQGELVLAGPFEDRSGGLYILRTSSLEEATRIAETDPFVASGKETCEVHTWLLSNAENNHLGMG